LIDCYSVGANNIANCTGSALQDIRQSELTEIGFESFSKALVTHSRRGAAIGRAACTVS